MQPPEEYNKAVTFLKGHSADEIRHFNGSLLSHLESTYRLLRDWGNAEDLCIAGLCHAAYGTDGFPASLIEVSQRSELERTIGAGAERLVYFYASCDRSFLYPNIPGGSSIQFRDRFTGDVFVPDAFIFKRFLELTFANELDIARGNADFLERHGPGLERLLQPCRDLVSAPAYACFLDTFGRN